MPSSTKVLVSSVDSDLEFNIEGSTTGKQLFEMVIRSLGIRESWYFGLLYVDKNNQSMWLDLTKKIKAQNLKKETPQKMKLLAKYYPEDAAQELILPLTKQMFFLQVLNSVLTEEYYTPPETAVLLASYALQAKHGDYNAEVHTIEFFADDKLLPEKVIRQHKLEKHEWDEKVIKWYKEHHEMERETAMTEYLKIAQDLDTYGVTYFDITNKKGSKLMLGVDAMGLNIYERSDKLTPKIGFPWSEVKKVSYSGKKFMVKTNDSSSPTFTFVTDKTETSKIIIGLCRGNYEMYSRRRRPDSIEVQQMKTQVKEDQAIKAQQRAIFLKEKEHRKEIEKQNVVLQQQLEDYKTRVQQSQEDIERTKETERQLREKLQELEDLRMVLEQNESEANEARKAAQEAAECAIAERLLKEEQAAEAHRLLLQKEDEVREKEMEARLLQEELSRNQSRVVVYEQQVTAHTPQIIQSPIQQHEIKTFQTYEEINELDRAIAEQSTNGDQLDSRESHEFTRTYEPEEVRDRVALAESNVVMGHQLQTLRQELEAARASGELDKNDQIYVKNVKQGRDKYKTLKQIRQGNTKIRIETFESM